MQAVRVENWGFAYPQSPAPVLSGVDFALEPGGFAVLCGASGSGKSTLLSHIKREMAPYGTQTGRVLIGGVDVQALPQDQSARLVGYVAQTPQTQIVTDTVWHELAFGLENLGVPAMTMRRRVAEIAHFFGIEPWFRQATDTLSGGQQQLVNLASVLVMQPSVLVLDEPTAQLDPVAARQFLRALKRVNDELGVTVLLCEHDLEEVLPLCDQVLYLQDGVLAFDGPPQDFLQFMARPACARFVPALPAASRLALSLGCADPMPLTVQQGRALVERQAGRLAADPLPDVPEPNGPACLTAKHLWFRYEAKAPYILQDWSLALYPGEIHALVGGNGCGKTTALSVLCGGLKPQRGKLKAEAPPALLCQDTRAMFVYDSIGKELRHAARQSGQAHRADELVRQLALSSLLDRHPYDVSVGERQRAALAKCLLSGANALLLDEPTKGMDAFSKQQVAQLLSLCKRMGQAVCLVTHDLEFAARVADRCSMMFDGTLIASDGGKAFFCGNQFYTTAVHRMTNGLLPGCVVQEDIHVHP